MANVYVSLSIPEINIVYHGYSIARNWTSDNPFLPLQRPCSKCISYYFLNCIHINIQTEHYTVIFYLNFNNENIQLKIRENAYQVIFFKYSNYCMMYDMKQCNNIKIIVPKLLNELHSRSGVFVVRHVSVMCNSGWHVKIGRHM